MDNPGNVLGVA